MSVKLSCQMRERPVVLEVVASCNSVGFFGSQAASSGRMKLLPPAATVALFRARPLPAP